MMNIFVAIFSIFLYLPICHGQDNFQDTTFDQKCTSDSINVFSKQLVGRIFMYGIIIDPKEVAEGLAVDLNENSNIFVWIENRRSCVDVEYSISDYMQIFKGDRSNVCGHFFNLVKGTCQLSIVNCQLDLSETTWFCESLGTELELKPLVIELN